MSHNELCCVTQRLCTNLVDELCSGERCNRVGLKTVIDTGRVSLESADEEGSSNPISEIMQAWGHLHTVQDTRLSDVIMKCPKSMWRKAIPNQELLRLSLVDHIGPQSIFKVENLLKWTGRDHIQRNARGKFSSGSQRRW